MGVLFLYIISGIYNCTFFKSFIVFSIFLAFGIQNYHYSESSQHKLSQTNSCLCKLEALLLEPSHLMCVDYLLHSRIWTFLGLQNLAVCLMHDMLCNIFYYVMDAELNSSIMFAISVL